MEGNIFTIESLGTVEETGNVCLGGDLENLRNILEKHEELNCPEQLSKFPASFILTIAIGAQPDSVFGR